MNAGKIRRLDPHEVQKIAAGEVVERPVNVLKELIENSLDAGATAITIYIQKAGRKLIRVVDNGSGMNKFDALCCFEPHATSKITSLDDLYNLNSFGFRGEALASIGSVSSITLITAQAGSEADATKVVFSHGKVTTCESTVGQVGSDFAVQDLFGNVPVRLKFLKRDETEWNQMYDWIQAVAMSNKSVYFKVFKDDQLVLNAPPVQVLKDRVCQLWDFYLADQMIELPHESGEVAISGIISRPTIQRYNRNDIFLFVNGRWVKNQNLARAVCKGYAQALPDGKYPVGMIFLTIDPAVIDVNVHPRKEEVLFVQPQRIEHAVTMAVKRALEDSVSRDVHVFAQPVMQHINQQRISDDGEVLFSPSPASSFDTQTNCLLRMKGDLPRSAHREIGDQSNGSPITSGMTISKDQNSMNNIETTSVLITHKTPLALRQSAEALAKAGSDVEGFLEAEIQKPLLEGFPSLTQQPITLSSELKGTLIGQLFRTYILIDQGENLLVIDQHAAHERILYEQMKQNFVAPEAIGLLICPVITVQAREYSALIKAIPLFKKWGIEIESFGHNQIQVLAFPFGTECVNLVDFFAELAHELNIYEGNLESESTRQKLFEHFHSHAACKAALKAGDELSHEQMRALIHDLAHVENRHMCIHGRPTMWKIAQKELAKHFRRI